MAHNFTVKEYPSLTAVVHKMVLRAPSKLDAKTIAELVAKPYQTLMSELSQQQGHKLGADTLLPLMDATNSNAVLDFLARERGGVFITLKPAAVNGGELAETLATSAKEYAEFMQETAVSISDGKIPRDQLDKILKEGRDAVMAIMDMMNVAQTTHEKQNGTGAGA